MFCIQPCSKISILKIGCFSFVFHTQHPIPKIFHHFQPPPQTEISHDEASAPFLDDAEPRKIYFFAQVPEATTQPFGGSSTLPNKPRKDSIPFFARTAPDCKHGAISRLSTQWCGGGSGGFQENVLYFMDFSRFCLKTLRLAVGKQFLIISGMFAFGDCGWVFLLYTCWILKSFIDNQCCGFGKLIEIEVGWGSCYHSEFMRSFNMLHLLRFKLKRTQKVSPDWSQFFQSHKEKGQYLTFALLSAKLE